MRTMCVHIYRNKGKVREISKRLSLRIHKEAPSTLFRYSYGKLLNALHGLNSDSLCSYCSEVGNPEIHPASAAALILSVNVCDFRLPQFNKQTQTPSEKQLTSYNTPYASIRRQKCQADSFAHSLMFFSHSPLYSKGEQTT